MSETQKAYKRRLEAGWFDKYIKLPCIEIGSGRFNSSGEDLVIQGAVSHDIDICDATTMDVYPDNEFLTVHSSHVIEHLNDPITAIQNWFRICKPGGYVVISAPHRDIYEKKKLLPSRWNPDHKYFLLPERTEPPHTFSLQTMVHTALEGNTYIIVLIEVANSCTNAGLPNEHGNGEYSIEIIIKKI